MTVSFTATEIIEIAEQVEENGAKFYRQAAENTGDKSAKQFFSQLAEMEANHKKIFADMLKAMTDGKIAADVFDPDDEMAYYLKAMASSAGWEGKAARDLKFSGNETPTEVIKLAIEAERASIDYYLGLKEMVSSADKAKVDEIIKEEMSHVVTLQKNLEQLKS